MSKQLTRKEIEALAAFFGCSITSTAVWNKGAVDYEIYVVGNGKREMAGITNVNNPASLPWTNHDWSRAFQRISGQSTADLWTQGKRGMR